MYGGIAVNMCSCEAYGNTYTPIIATNCTQFHQTADVHRLLGWCALGSMFDVNICACAWEGNCPLDCAAQGWFKFTKVVGDVCSMTTEIKHSNCQYLRPFQVNS